MLVKLKGNTTTTLTLPEEVVGINDDILVIPGGTATNSTLTPKNTSSPSSGDAGFTGTPQAPSKTITLNSALPATTFLIIDVQQIGSIPTNK